MRPDDAKMSAKSKIFWILLPRFKRLFLLHGPDVLDRHRLEHSFRRDVLRSRQEDLVHGEA